MRRPGQVTSVVLTIAALGATPRIAAATGNAPRLLPVHLTAPADGAAIPGNGDPADVQLAWSTPREPVSVRFFVEVVAIESSGVHEIFAGYVDRPPIEVTLAGGPAAYAWRVYAVGQDVAEYAPSGWERFSLRPGK